MVQLSFDDGHSDDLIAFDTVKDLGFDTTFYVPSVSIKGDRGLSEDEIRMIRKHGFYIGGHTVTHPEDMKRLQEIDLDDEVQSNKAWLEEVIGEPVTRFCYPSGRHNERVREAVKRAGFTEARTTLVCRLKNEKDDPFQTPTTIHVAPRKEYLGNSWLETARILYRTYREKKAQGKDVFFHVWGHSWEITNYGYWKDLREFLLWVKYMETVPNYVGVDK